ncbi:MAG: type II CAAX endopeptidase family protein [Deltaproteobacteria bacterium]|nr:type II CAAX endopeptidase family protein [Deltaproteobacteria bacterium]
MEPTHKIGFKTLILSTGSVACVEILLLILPKACGIEAMIALGSARIVDISLIVLVICLSEGLSAIGVSSTGLTRGIKRGILWSAAVGCGAFLGFGIFYVLGINLLPLIHTQVPSGGLGILLLFCVGGLVGPIAEELFFRGIVYGFLRQWGALAAVMGSTLLFVPAHPGGYNQIPAMQAIGGVLFSLSYEIEKNLLVPILIHVLGNISIFVLSLGTLPGP